MEKNRNKGFCVKCNRPLKFAVICDYCVVEIYLRSFISGKSVESYAKKYGVALTTLSNRLEELRRNRVIHRVLFEVVEQMKELYGEE